MVFWCDCIQISFWKQTSHFTNAIFKYKFIIIFFLLSAVIIPAHEIHSVGDFLRGLLCRDPKQRISAEEALCHPFFTDNITKEIERKGNMNESGTKINAFRSFVSNLRNQNKSNFFFYVYL